MTVSDFIRNVLDYVFAGSRDFPESPLVAWQPHSDKKRRRDCVNDGSNVAVLFSDLKHSLWTLYVQFWAVQDERSQLLEICSGLQSRILVLYHSVSFSISDQIKKVCFDFAVFWNHHMLADDVPTFGVSLSHNLTYFKTDVWTVWHIETEIFHLSVKCNETAGMHYCTRFRGLITDMLKGSLCTTLVEKNLLAYLVTLIIVISCYPWRTTYESDPPVIR